MSNYGPYTGDTYEGSPEESHDMEAEAAAAFAQSMEAENVDAMAEQDERTIYRWILGHEIAENHLPYPRLDMNFAFNVCIPRLMSEGVKVMFNNMGSGEWWLDVPTPENVTDVLHEDSDFYSALLAYIKGNSNA